MCEPRCQRRQNTHRMVLSHYDILRIQRNAPLTQIKSAYRHQARIHHPDKGGNPEIFRLLNEAYVTLSTPETRRTYDSHSLSVSDLFDRRYAEPFYLSAPRHTTTHSIVVSLHAVATGDDAPFVFLRTCVDDSRLVHCTQCSGTGILYLPQRLGGFPRPRETPPPCTQCLAGYVPDSIETYTIQEHLVCRLPAGCPNGTIFRFAAKGHQFAGTAPADLVVRIIYAAPSIMNHTIEVSSRR